MSIQDFYTYVFSVRNEKLMNILVQNSVIQIVKKGMTICHQGDLSNYLFFLLKGISYFSVVDSGGEEIAVNIRQDTGDLISGDSLHVLFYPATVTMLTDGCIVTIPTSVAKLCFDTFNDFKDLYFYILRKDNVQLQAVNKMLYMKRVEDRYQWFTDKYPNAINEVNHYQIAHFLNISPVTLSRIRHKSSVFKHTGDLRITPQKKE